MASNELFLTVLPIVHLGINQFGLTEQVLTLFPDRGFATEFFPDEVDSYIQTFKARAGKYLTGGHVTSYEFERIQTQENRVIVRVFQNVA